MSDACPPPDSQELLLARMLEDVEAQGPAAAADYRRRYPHLAGEIDSLLAWHDRLASGAWCSQAAPPDPDDGAELPPRLGEFRMLRRVAIGGMGEVWEAEQERLHRRVAVKIIRRGRTSPSAAARFLREQNVLARLHQTHIVPIHTAGEADGLQYFAMPFIDGEAVSRLLDEARQEQSSHPDESTPTLVELARRHPDTPPDNRPTLLKPAAPSAAPGPQPDPISSTQRLRHSRDYICSAATLLANVADALDHAHAAGILHRDVKPSNIMLDRAGFPWIIDFGLAGYVQGPAPAPTPGDSASVSLMTSKAMGTPRYMAPEQYNGRVDARSDVWGLGCTLYEVLTLRPAFNGPSQKDLQHQITAGEPPPIDSLTRGVPADLAAICRKALNKAPNDRYPTAAAFAADLRRWLDGEPTGARPPWLPRRAWMWARRNRGRAALATAVIVAFFVGVLAALLAQQAQVQERSYELRLLQMQRDHLGKPIGWSADRLNLVRDHARNRSEKGKRQSRDDAAATLIGLDAMSRLTIPQEAGSLAFRRDGKALLLGGVGKADSPRPSSGGVWYADGNRFTPSSQPLAVTGPVAFAVDGTPLQLVPRGPLTLLLWDAQRQKPVREFTLDPKALPGELTPESTPSLALSDDGARVAAATRLPDGKPALVVWDAATGKELWRQPRAANVLAFAPDASVLAAADDSGDVSVWDVAKGTLQATLPGNRLPLQCLALARDPLRRHKDGRQASGWLLAAGGVGGSLTIWDVARAQVRTRCTGSHFEVSAVAFSPDASLLASADRGPPRLWDVATGQPVLLLIARNTFTSVAFSPDGKSLAAASVTAHGYPGDVQVYDLEPGRGVLTLRGLRAPVELVARSPDGRFVAGLAHDWQVGVWDISTGRLLHVFEAPPGRWADNGAIAFSNDGRLACASWNKAVWWDLATGRELGARDLPPGLTNLLTFRSTGQLMLFRNETEDMKAPPLTAWPPDRFPRVQRLRNLLAPADEKPIVVTPGFDMGLNSGFYPPFDGAYFLVAGTRRVGQGVEWGAAAYDSVTGQQVWNRATYDAAGSPPRYTVTLGPTGKLAVIYVQPPGRKAVPRYLSVELPGGTARESLTHAGALGLGAEWWARMIANVDDSSRAFGYGIYRRGTDGPLLTLGNDNAGTSGDHLFSTDGRYLVWGGGDGTVTVADIPEIHKRLAAVGLGWPPASSE